LELKGIIEQPATGEEHDVPSPSKDPGDPPTIVDRFSWLVEQARNGNAEVLPELRQMLDGRPEVWEFYGNLGRHAELAWIEAIVGSKDLFLRETVWRRLARIREDLGIAQASPLEKLLIERIAMSWMRVHHADMAAAQALTGSNSIKMVHFWQKQLNAADRRYLASIGTLATLRRLLPSAATQESPGPAKALPTIQSEAEIPGCDLTPPLRVVGREH
jgi:hypothetical protein